MRAGVRGLGIDLAWDCELDVMASESAELPGGTDYVNIRSLKDVLEAFIGSIN